MSEAGEDTWVVRGGGALCVRSCQSTSTAGTIDKGRGKAGEPRELYCGLRCAEVALGSAASLKSVYSQVLSRCFHHG